MGACFAFTQNHESHSREARTGSENARSKTKKDTARVSERLLARGNTSPREVCKKFVGRVKMGALVVSLGETSVTEPRIPFA